MAETMQERAKSASNPLECLEFSNDPVSNRILLKKALPELINLDTSISILIERISVEEFDAYKKYVNLILQENPADNLSVAGISPNLQEKARIYHISMMKILKYVKNCDKIELRSETTAEDEFEIENCPVDDSDLLFYLIMGIFEEHLFGLYKPYCIQYVIYAIAMTNYNRMTCFLSFLCSLLQGNDQRRMISALFMASFVGHIKKPSQDALEIILEYVRLAKERISTVNDKFSRVLLSGLRFINENNPKIPEISDFLTEFEGINGEPVVFPFDKAPIAAYQAIIDEITDEIME
ncbi:hypothetical protein NEAUS06_1823 [Nematocida ausubeli]|nr:hypothetical protein NEAUS06_1823 [Nematocida ausubeli]